MQMTPTPLPGVLVLEPTVYRDERGAFYESYHRLRFRDLTGYAGEFVQDNHSSSCRNALRGLHYQIERPQGKLVRVVAGEVFDVVVDLRASSPTFGQWLGTRLSAANKKMLWVPPGFAHGFLVLSECCEYLYKTTAHWAPQHERCIRWDDPTLAIDWPLSGSPVMSSRDLNGVRFKVAEVYP